MSLLRLLPALWILAACTPEKKADTEPADITLPAAWGDVVDRAVAMSEAGWVVSRWSDGSAEHRGDSLLFTAIAMGAVSAKDCARAAPFEHALLTMLEANDGLVHRHPLIAGYSLDGLLGLWWGIDKRIRACPESRGRWATILPAHARIVHIEPFFDVVLQQVMAELGIAAEPSAYERGRLGSEIAGWAIAVVGQKEPAYRLHLGFLALDVIDAPNGKTAFCHAVRGSQIALLDEFCDRGEGIAPFFRGFAFNLWEYAHQRSPAWETPDGKPGLLTPAIDLLVGWLYVDD
jgi:hypothetical protein